MTERSARKSFLMKGAASIAKPVAKQIEGTVKTVAKEARRGGDLGPKVASGAAKSLGSGGASAKAAVTGGLTALKDAGGQVLGKGGQNGNGGSGAKAKVTNIIEEIDIGAPRRLVYDKWTRFEEFPSFMKKVESTEQTADEKVRWKAKIFWSTRTWESTIIEQVPDERIVWRSTGAKGYVDGAVTFHELASDLTRVLLVLEYHPHGLMEKTGNLWRAQGRRARLELKHFRRHVMSQALLHSDRDVDGWRGEIHDGEVAASQEDSASVGKRTGDGRKSDRQTGDKRRRTSSQNGRTTGSRSRSTGSSDADESSGEKSSATKSSGTRRSSGAKKSSTSGRSSGGRGGSNGGSSSSGTRRSTSKQTAGAEDK
ncbi:MAG: SRPBCC family protein [Actinoallomurus sp.]